MVAAAVAVGAITAIEVEAGALDGMLDEVRVYAGYAGDEPFSDAVLEVVGRVERHKFVPPGQVRYAYENRPLPIGHGQTISQPYIVALMTDLLVPDEDDVVLEEPERLRSADVAALHSRVEEGAGGSQQPLLQRNQLSFEGKGRLHLGLADLSAAGVPGSHRAQPVCRRCPPGPGNRTAPARELRELDGLMSAPTRSLSATEAGDS